MASFAARYGAYLARGALRKWGPWAARKYGGRAAGAIGAAAAGGAAGYYTNKRKRADSGYSERPAKRVSEKPSNDDTNINLNETYNATSLYKRHAGKRRLSRRAKTVRRKRVRFSKKIRKIVKQSSKWNWFKGNRVNGWDHFNVPYANFGTLQTGQDVFPEALTASWQLMALPGPQASNATAAWHIRQQMNDMGHIEDGILVSDTNIGDTKTKMLMTSRWEGQLVQSRAEYTNAFPLWIDIYEFVAVKNITDIEYSTPQRAWNTILQDYKAPTAEALNSQYTKGTRPTDNDLLAKWWKVSQITRVRMVDSTRFQYDMNTSGTYSHAVHSLCYAMAGITKALMLIVAPIYVATTPVAYDLRLMGINQSVKFKPLDVPGVTPNQKVQWNFYKAL